MKKNILKFIGLLLMVTAFISCNKDKVDPVASTNALIDVPSCKVTSINYELLYLGTSQYTERTTITYNADGYPDKMMYSDGWSVIFVYSGGKLSKIIESNGVSSYEETYEWDGDKIAKSVENHGGLIGEYRYAYNGDKVSRITNWDNYSGAVMGDMVEYGYQEFTWTGENITKSAYFYNDFSGGRVEFIKKKKKRSFISSGRTEGFTEGEASAYTYDSKLNPLRFLGYILNEGSMMGANNVLTETYTKGITYTSSTSYTYEYNAENFPTKSTEIDGDYTRVSTYTYDCN